MSTTVLSYPSRRTAALWQWLVKALLVSVPKGRSRCKHRPHLVDPHDVGLERKHQDYAPRGRSTHGTMRQLHARAERIAAGLPEA